MAAALLFYLLAALSPGAQAADTRQLLLGQSGGDSAEQIALPEDISPEEALKLVAQMSDEQARRELLLLLEARQQSQRKQGDGGLGVALVHFRKRLEATSSRLRKQTAQLQTGLMQFPSEFSTALGKIPGQSSWPSLLGQLLLFAALGFAGFGAVAFATLGLRAELMATSPSAANARYLNAGQRAFLEFLALLAFAVLAFGGITLFYGAGGAARNFVVTFLSGLFLMLGVIALTRILLAPRSPGLRLLPLGQKAANFLFRWLNLLAGFSIFIWLTAGLIILTGMKLPSHLFLVMLTGAATVVLLLFMIVRGRKLLADTIVGEEPSRMRQKIAVAAPILLILYVLAVWLSWANSILLREPAGIWQAILGVALLVSLPSADLWCLAALRRLFRIDRLRETVTRLQEKQAAALAAAEPDTGGEADLAESSDSSLTPDIVEAQGRLAARQRYVAITIQTIRLLVGLLVVFFVSAQLGFDITGLGAEAAQAVVLGAIASLAVTAIVTMILWRFIASFFDPYMPQERDVMHGDEDGGTPQTRLETLMPLLRTTAKVVLIVFAVMIALSNLGVNIGPLIAGAGVIGIAIGFGAQKLVQDIVSGIFFLIDDAFRVGEYIEFDQLRGEVEAITLRSLKLRHHRGAVHTVPFSELRTVTNYNRDWIIYKMEFRLPHDVDVEKVRKMIKKIGLEMMEDPIHGPNLYQPLKSQGIQRMDETAVILRTKFMCKPREQFVLRRVAFQRIKEAFQAAGIEFAGRHVTVRTEAGDKGEEVAAAAAMAQEEAGQAGKSGDER